MLFFAKAPEVFIEKALIRCVAFGGLDKEFIIDDKSFGGPLYLQYSSAMAWLRDKLNVSYFGKKSHSRNPLILGLFARMNLVEQLGSGLIRMKNLMKAASLKEPVFKTQGIFTVVFSRPKTFGEKQKPSEKVENLRRKLQKPSEKILTLIKLNPKITIEELSTSLNKTTRAIELQLSKLKEQGLITRVGSDKLGEWKLR